MVHCEYTADDKTTVADVKQLYDLGYQSVSLNMSRLSGLDADRLLSGLNGYQLLAVTMPEGMPSQKPIETVSLDKMEGKKFADNVVIDVRVLCNIDKKKIPVYMQRLPLRNVIILHSSDAQDLITGTRDIIEMKDLTLLLPMLVNFGKAEIKTTEDARRLGYNWPADDLPSLTAEQVQILRSGTLEGSGIDTNSAIADQTDKLSESLRQSFLAAIAEKSLIKDRLYGKNKGLARDYAAGKFRFGNPLYEEILGTALVRESLMTDEEMLADRQSAATVKRGNKPLPSFLMMHHEAIITGKEQPGAVSAVIDAILQDVVLDYRIRKSSHGRPGTIDFKYVDKILTAA